jgi:hypothetical protein
MSICKSVVCGKVPGEIRRGAEVGGRLSPAEPDAGATASARDMNRLIPMVCSTTLRKKKKNMEK